MHKSMNTKLVQTFIVFILSVMVAVGVILLLSVFNFYKNDFVAQMDNGFTDRITNELAENLKKDDFATSCKELLSAYSGTFGFDDNRSFYILDMNGRVLATNNLKKNITLDKTRNMLAAMNGENGKKQSLGADFMDYALYVGNENKSCIVYITDNLSKMRSLISILFSIIIQSLLIGLLVAVILAFFLAKAITAPLNELTGGTMKISSGDYSHRLSSASSDEFGTLTENFNAMAQVIENNIDGVNREKEKLSKIISCLADGVAAFDKNGELMFINKAARHFLSLPKDKCVSFDEFTGALDVPVAMHLLAASKSVNVSEHKIQTTFSSETVVDVSFTVFTYDKTETGYLAVIHDVTEKSLLEKSRREFIANVSHELRTPLTSIKGATETIMDDEEMPLSIRKRFLGIVINESDRMTRIVKDLLVLSRFDNRRMTWQASSFPVSETVSQICTALKTVAEKKNQTLTYCDEGKVLGTMTMTADKERIEQVLTNIIGNALKYTPENGSVEVSAESAALCRTENSDPEPFVRITVKDNGIGIPAEDLPHLFERFYRVDKARTSDMGGTGLGLPIAKEIVEAHGGRLLVRSVEKNGTSVTIELPLATGIG